MPSTAQVETAEFVTIQAICSALQYDSFWAIILHDLADHALENVFIRLVVDAVIQRNVDCVILAFGNTNIPKFASAREEFSTVDRISQ